MARRPPRLGQAPQAAELVVRNARAYVGSTDRAYVGSTDRAPRFAEGFAVRDGQILAVGTDAEMAALAQRDTAVIDVAGRTVIPGLIDSHLHLVRGGLTWTTEIRWFEVPTLEAGLNLLRAAAETSSPGTWLRVIGGWHPGQFAEGRGPTHDELTQLFPDHPVYIQLLYEDAVLNAAGLEACSITSSTPDPERGAFARHSDGTPTGTVRGIGAFLHCLAHMPDPGFGDKVEGTRQILAELNGYGLTGGIDAGGLGMPPENYEPLFQLWREEQMTLRTRLYVGPLTRGAEREELRGWLRHTRPGFGDEWLRQVGLGEIAVFGCHDLEGLAPFTVDDASKQQLREILIEAASRRWPVHMHAVLDATTNAILDVWEDIAADHAIGKLRWSLAHLEPASARNLDRIARLGVGVAVQNRMVYRATDSARVWGDDAVRNGPPLRSILDRGIPLGGGTDSTRVASPNPWVSLWWMVTGGTFDAGPRRNPDQCLDRVTALDAYTVGSAWFSFEETQRGRLASGMAADFAVLSDDYFGVSDEEILTLRSDLTVVDGRAVHAEGAFAGLI